LKRKSAKQWYSTCSLTRSRVFKKDESLEVVVPTGLFWLCNGILSAPFPSKRKIVAVHKGIDLVLAKLKLIVIFLKALQKQFLPGDGNSFVF
jgi:hypothetical protein